MDGASPGATGRIIRRCCVPPHGANAISESQDDGAWIDKRIPIALPRPEKIAIKFGTIGGKRNGGLSPAAANRMSQGTGMRRATGGHQFGVQDLLETLGVTSFISRASKRPRRSGLEAKLDNIMVRGR